MAWQFSSRDFLLNHISAVRAVVTIPNATDRENIAVLEEELHTVAKAHKRYNIYRAIVFVLLYASVISNFALPEFKILMGTILFLGNLVGAGLLSVAVLYFTWRIGQQWNRMLIIGSHILSVYEKHNKGVYAVREEPELADALKRINPVRILRKKKRK